MSSFERVHVHMRLLCARACARTRARALPFLGERAGCAPASLVPRLAADHLAQHEEREDQAVTQRARRAAFLKARAHATRAPLEQARAPQASRTSFRAREICDFAFRRIVHANDGERVRTHARLFADACTFTCARKQTHARKCTYLHASNHLRTSARTRPCMSTQLQNCTGS
eukprot:3576371-Pleurochrysis_carterae.AAC.2